MKIAILITGIVLSISRLAATETILDSFYLKREDFSNKIENLKKEYGQRKSIPPEIELECLTALSFYPELKSVSIEFDKKKMFSTMQAQPKPFTLFRKKEKRRYVIFINENQSASTNLNFNDLSFNAKVGWIGHELAHILYYDSLTSAELLWLAVSLISPRKISRYERHTDILAIQHCLGYALYEGMHYVYNNSKASEKYLKKLRKNYLSLEEILYYIRKTRCNHVLS